VIYHHVSICITKYRHESSVDGRPQPGEIDSKELKVAMRALGFEPKKANRWCGAHDWLVNMINIWLINDYSMVMITKLVYLKLVYYAWTEVGLSEI
jgi:hypothetical protein